MAFRPLQPVPATPAPSTATTPTTIPTTSGFRPLDATATAAPAVATQPVKSTAPHNAAAGFLGVEKFGQGYATAVRVNSGEADQSGKESYQSLKDTTEVLKTLHNLPKDDPRREHLVNFLKQTIDQQSYTPQSQIDPGTTLSNKEVLGSAANVALAATMGGKLSSFNGAGQVSKTAQAVNKVAAPFSKSTVLGKAGNLGVQGAAYGLAGGLNDGKSGTDLVKSTATGAAFGAGASLAGSAIGKTKELVFKDGPRTLMDRAVKPTVDELKKNVKYGSKTLSDELLNEGVKGTSKGLLEISERELTQNEDKLQAILQHSDGTVKKADIAKYLEPAITKIKKTPGVTGHADTFTEVLNDLPDTMTVSEANEIKRLIYDELRDVAYHIDPKLSKTKEAMKLVAKGLKTEVEKQSGNADEVIALNKKLSIYGRLEKRVVNELARTRPAMDLKDMLISGFASQHPLGWATLIGKKTFETTVAKTYAAQGLHKVEQLTQKPAAQAIKKGVNAVAKKAVLNAN